MSVPTKDGALLAALNDEYGDQGWDELRSLSRIVLHHRRP